MPKREMTQEEKILFNELRLLVKRANQRILRMERKTGIKESFGTKQLYDYLSSKPLDAISEKGRVKLNQSFTLQQLKAIKTATENFLNKNISGIRDIKKYIEKYSNLAGKKLSYKMANAYYQVTHDLSWLYDSSLTESVFWRDFAPLVKTRSKDNWVELVSEYKSAVVDRTIKKNLEILYDYLKAE